MKKGNLSEIRYSWVVIFIALVCVSWESHAFTQVLSADTVYNQPCEWKTGDRVSLPDWLFVPRHQGCVIAVSDPCMKPEAARMQALQRAAYLFSLQQGARLNLLSEVFSTVETTINTYEDQRSKMLTLGVMEQSLRCSAYRIEKEYTSMFGELFLQVSFAQAGSCDLTFHSVSEMMLLFTKERVEEEEIKFNLLVEADNGSEQPFRSEFQLKGALVSPKIHSCINGVPIRFSQKGCWYVDTHCTDSSQEVIGVDIRNGFWEAYIASFVKTLLLYPYSAVKVSQVDDNYRGGNSSGCGLYREKVNVVLAISSFIKEIRDNRLVVDWQITEQQCIKGNE